MVDGVSSPPFFLYNTRTQDSRTNSRTCPDESHRALAPAASRNKCAFSQSSQPATSIRTMITMTITMTRWKMTRRSCQSGWVTGKPRNLVSIRPRSRSFEPTFELSSLIMNEKTPIYFLLDRPIRFSFVHAFVI